MESGKLYFFTASIIRWINVLQNDERKKIILDSFSYLNEKKLVKISAFVLMPNHIHIIWQLLDTKLQLRFMKYTAQQIKFHLAKNDPGLLDQFYISKMDRSYQIS